MQASVHSQTSPTAKSDLAGFHGLVIPVASIAPGTCYAAISKPVEMQGLGSKVAGRDRAAPSDQEMAMLEESSDDGEASEEEDEEEGEDPDEDRRCRLSAILALAVS